MSGHTPLVLPPDEHNAELEANVHPPDWQNPAPAKRYDVVVVGGGTAGLVTAAGAAGLGARVALVERHLLGGDCLNVGCVPSKCIIRSGQALCDVLAAGEYGARVPEGAEVDFGAVMARMRKLRARISHHDAAQRFRDLGVDVFIGPGRFAGPKTLDVDGVVLNFKRAVIATGARAVEPNVPGLADAGFLTNETVFSLTERPPRLAVFGAGPLGCELAQAFRRLGSEVTIVEMADHLLPREDRDAAELIADAFRRDGVAVRESCTVTRVELVDGGKRIHMDVPAGRETLVVDEILVGAGRAPNVQGLGLAEAGVDYDERRGVRVDDRLRTTNKRIFAAGDICLRLKFTHTADAAARIVLQNMLFFGRKRLSSLIVPWCTYTDPQIAHVGMCEHDARAAAIEVDTFSKAFDDVDRAVTDGEESGLIKVHVRKGTDKILGATIVARHAGEMINEITLAMVAGIGLGTISGVIHPYPTQAEAIKHVADAYSRTRLTPFAAKVLKFLIALHR